MIPHGVELAIILLVVAALLFLGPQKIPDFARSLGRAISEFRKARNEISQEMTK